MGRHPRETLAGRANFRRMIMRHLRELLHAIAAIAIASAISILVVPAASSATSWQVARNGVSDCFNGNTSCFLLIAQVPAGRRLNIQSLTCRMTVGGAAADVLFARAEVRAASNTLAFSHYVAPVRTGEIGGTAYFALNYTGFFFVPAGHRLFVYVESDGSNIVLDCGASGELLP
jgi:hypothetical protein